MVKKDSLENLLEYLVKSIVEKPQAVKISSSQAEDGLALILEVDPGDLGLIIGKKGKTIQAIRTLARMKASQEGKRVNIQLLDDQKGEKPV
ncbi:MAG TPA: KH domain-containing protein [Candidatus Bathyarchaeia archaeon]|nr:KH domain-containing protein [Candidatus Bathyarchaeia archaeon]